jgi:hypothetical protein
VHPLDIQGAEDAAGIRSGQAQHVDLDQLGDVPEDVRGLGGHQSVEER